MALNEKLIKPMEGDEDEMPMDVEMAEYARTAKKETVESRIEGMKQLREHIQNSDIIQHCYSGGLLLRLFLRSCKYDIVKSKEQLDTFLVYKTKYPQWLGNISAHDKDITKHYTKGCGFLLFEKSSDGTCIAFIDPDALGIYEVNLDHIVKAILLGALAHFYAHPECTLKGIKVVVDCSKLSLAYARTLDLYEGAEALFTAFAMMKGIFKALILVGSHKLYCTMFDMVRPFLPENIRKKIVFLKTFADVESHGINLSSLPAEYGGTVHRNIFIEETTKMVNNLPEVFLTVIWPQMRVCESVAEQAKRNTPRGITMTLPLLNFFIYRFVPKIEPIDACEAIEEEDIAHSLAVLA